jgi:hypothetical protein
MPNVIPVDECCEEASARTICAGTSVPSRSHSECNDCFGGEDKTNGEQIGRLAAQTCQLLPGASQRAAGEDLLARGIDRRETHGGEFSFPIKRICRL